MGSEKLNRRQREAQERRRRQRRQRSLKIGVPLTAAVGAIVVGALVVSREDGGSAVGLDGVETVDVGSQPRHVDGEVKYSRTPPAGGDHAPRWQNCGFYPQPVKNENGVHSMEHGAVWITYATTLAQDEQNALRTLSRERDYVLISPMDGLSTPVVASAWGKQLQLPSVSDPRLNAFLQEYVNGDQTLEPGAPCTSGEGMPT